MKAFVASHCNRCHGFHPPTIDWCIVDGVEDNKSVEVRDTVKRNRSIGCERFDMTSNQFREQGLKRWGTGFLYSGWLEEMSTDQNSHNKVSSWPWNVLTRSRRYFKRAGLNKSHLFWMAALSWSWQQALYFRKGYELSKCQVEVTVLFNIFWLVNKKMTTFQKLWFT